MDTKLPGLDSRTSFWLLNRRKPGGRSKDPLLLEQDSCLTEHESLKWSCLLETMLGHLSAPQDGAGGEGVWVIPPHAFSSVGSSQRSFLQSPSELKPHTHTPPGMLSEPLVTSTYTPHLHPLLVAHLVCLLAQPPQTLLSITPSRTGTVSMDPKEKIFG